MLADPQRRGRVGLAAEFCAAIADDELRVIEVTPHDYRRTAELLTTYSSLRLQVVDACVIALAERLDLHEVATLDRRDFQIVVATCRKGSGSSCCRKTDSLYMRTVVAVLGGERADRDEQVPLAGDLGAEPPGTVAAGRAGIAGGGEGEPGPAGRVRSAPACSGSAGRGGWRRGRGGRSRGRWRGPGCR
jgi:PIN domain